MINEDKIIDYLHNELKLALYEIDEAHKIIVSSPISNLGKLNDFVLPLNYYLSFVCSKIYINPRF